MYTRMLIEELKNCDNLNVFPIEHPQQLKSFLKGDHQLDPHQTVLHYPFFDLFFSTLPLFRPFKTIVTVHDLIPLKFPQQYPPGKRGQLRFFKQAFALQRVEAIITDSVASQTDLTELLQSKPEKLHIIPLAAAAGLCPPSEETQLYTLKQYHLRQPYVLYVGDINYNKNIPQLIKMVKFLADDVDLVCVGKNFTPQEIPEWKWIETQLALSDVSHRVHFISTLETQDLDQLSSLYAKATAYIQPSLYEGFGLPVLEAMQCRCPVICSNTSSLPEVSGGYALLVQPEAEQFATAVKEIMGWSKTYRQDYLNQAYQWSQRFSWQRVATETVNVYAQVLGQS